MNAKRVARCGALAVLAVFLVACGGSTIKADKAEQSVTDLVGKQTGYTPSDVRCPGGLAAEVGTSFDCSFSGPDGAYVAHVKVLKINGEQAQFDIRTEPRR